MVAISLPQPEPADWPPAPPVAPAPRAPRPAGPPRAAAPTGRPRLDRATRYRRRRLAAVVLVTLVIIVGVPLAQALSAVLSSEGQGSPARPAVERPLAVEGDVYVVRPGDTLWTIAASLAPDVDPRPVVDELRQANGEAALEVGDRIRVDVDGLP